MRPLLLVNRGAPRSGITPFDLAAVTQVSDAVVGHDRGAAHADRESEDGPLIGLAVGRAAGQRVTD